MKNLNKIQIADLLDTSVTTMWLNHGKAVVGFNGNLYDYCENNGYKFTKKPLDYIKISYNYGANDYVINTPANTLIRTLTETIVTNLIYLGDDSTLQVYSAKHLGLYKRKFKKEL